MQGTPERTRWVTAAVVVFLGVCAALSIGKLPPALPALRAEFGLTLAQSGTLVSVFNTLGMAASIFMGLASAPVGAWRACMLGLALLAGGGVLGAASTTLASLLVARFLEGSGFLAVVVAAPALLNHATAPADRRRVFGWWGSYMPTGTALALLLAPPLLAAAGWRLLWLVVALCALLAVGLLHARRGDCAAPEGQATLGAGWRSAAAPLTAVGPWCVALCFACYVFNYYAVMVWLPTFLVGERQVALTTASLLTALVVAANIPGNLLGGRLLQRGVPRGTLVCAAGVCTLIACSMMFATALNDGVRLLACIGFSFGVGVLPGSVMSAANDHARTPAQVATVQGMVMQGSNLGQFLSPLLVAAVVARGTPGALAWEGVRGLLLTCGSLVIVGGLWLRSIERSAIGRP